MNRLHCALVLSALALSPTAVLIAQSGHWEGAIKVPDNPVRIEVDIAKNAKGELLGAFTNPAYNVKGAPLSNVVVDGTSIRFELKAGAGGGTFAAAIAEDGTSMSGTFNTTEGGHSIPFSLTRTGDARIDAPPKSPPIGKELEGTWNGTLDVNGTARRLVLTMSNQADGTSTASLLSVDGGGVAIPVAIVQKGTSVMLDVQMVGGSYAGTLNADGTELVGSWKQGQAALPLTFKRAPGK